MKLALHLQHGCTAPMAWRAAVRGQNVLSNDSIIASTAPRFGYQPSEGKSAAAHSEGTGIF
ncbi:hypothetical protein [Burkholderia ambifaria]|jgi:hypothetical protein|uniref:hypothetical protein n=1 Tax=Burkholderia ambifaria TaxID=152480 RepID=UPI000F572833|nr:hypothetical protein [Burkholderia ambifaria]